MERLPGGPKGAPNKAKRIDGDVVPACWPGFRVMHSIADLRQQRHLRRGACAMCTHKSFAYVCSGLPRI